jgi:hypothetical protein
MTEVIIKIEDERFSELISNVNFFQRLLYVPYAVITSAAIGILYGLFFSLPIIWLPSVQAKGIALVIVMLCVIFCASVTSTIFVYTKHGIATLVLALTFIAIMIAGPILASYSPMVHVDEILFDLLLGYGFWSVYIIGMFGAFTVSFFLRLTGKSVEITTRIVADLSQLELKQPFGKEFSEYRNLATTLPEYFDDLRKVMKKRSSQNILKQWFIKCSALLAGCGVILYLPIIAVIALFDLIGQLNLVIQRWGVYQILRITTPDKIKQGVSS